MKKQAARAKAGEEEKLRDFASSVGDFIRYWGFRRIHGQLWAQVYLSKERLSGAELTERLGVSKALVSPALRELEANGLIHTSYDGNKTKRYSAEPDVLKVIKEVLLKRESRLIQKVARNLAALEKSQASDSLLQAERMLEVRRMVDLAQLMIAMLVEQMNEDAMAGWAKALRGES